MSRKYPFTLGTDVWDPMIIRDFEAFYRDYVKFCEGQGPPDTKYGVYMSLKAAGYRCIPEPTLFEYEHEWGELSP